jgi:hypothetical protein
MSRAFVLANDVRFDIDTDAGLSRAARYMVDHHLLRLPVWHWSDHHGQYVSRWALYRLDGFSKHVFFG